MGGPFYRPEASGLDLAEQQGSRGGFLSPWLFKLASKEPQSLQKPQDLDGGQKGSASKVLEHGLVSTGVPLFV